MSDGQMHLAGKREGIRGELRRNVLGQLKDQIYLEDEQLYDQIDAAIRQKGREVYLPLKERLWLRNSLYDSFRRLDILQELLDDKEVTEIMINGAGKIFIEKKGKMLLWNRRFEKTEQLEDIIQQIVGKVNRIVNVSSPIADARLEDGSRVHIVLPPVALDADSVYSMLKRLSKKTDINSHPHQLRHYFAEERRKEGWDLNDIRFALGHKKVETTIKYLGENNERLIEATDQYYSNNEDLYQIADFL